MRCLQEKPAIEEQGGLYSDIDHFFFKLPGVDVTSLRSPVQTCQMADMCSKYVMYRSLHFAAERYHMTLPYAAYSVTGLLIVP